jgi:hypothetical protein
VDGDLREAYLDLALPVLDLRLGRQVITWGVGDLIFITDVFPKDWVAFVSGLPLEYLKKGVDAASLTGHGWGASAQLVLVPRFRSDTVPAAGDRLRFHDPAADIGDRRTAAGPVPGAHRGRPAALSEPPGLGRLPLRLPGLFHAPAGRRARAAPAPVLPAPRCLRRSGQGAALGGVVSLEAGYYDSRADRSGRNPAIENSSIRWLGATSARSFRT